MIADVARPWAGIAEIASQKTGYLNGYRGSRAQRAGYRRYRDGYWYPPAAFGAAITVNLSVTIVLDRPAIPPAALPALLTRTALSGGRISERDRRRHATGVCRRHGRILPNSLIV